MPAPAREEPDRLVPPFVGLLRRHGLALHRFVERVARPVRPSAGAQAELAVIGRPVDEGLKTERLPVVPLGGLAENVVLRAASGRRWTARAGPRAGHPASSSGRAAAPYRSVPMYRCAVAPVGRIGGRLEIALVVPIHRHEPRRVPVRAVEVEPTLEPARRRPSASRAGRRCRADSRRSAATPPRSGPRARRASPTPAGEIRPSPSRARRRRWWPPASRPSRWRRPRCTSPRRRPARNPRRAGSPARG